MNETPPARPASSSDGEAIAAIVSNIEHWSTRPILDRSLFARETLLALRELGWRAPHDPVTEQMEHAAMVAYRRETGTDPNQWGIREAIAAAIGAGT